MKIKIYCPFTKVVDRICKANSVQFEYLTPFDNKIINAFRSVEDLNKFRMNLFNLYKTKVKISPVSQGNGLVGIEQGFSLNSDIFDISDNDLGRCLPYYIVKDFFRWSKIQHRYINRERVLFFDYM